MWGQTYNIHFRKDILKCYDEKENIDIPHNMYNNKYMYNIKEDLK
jgi:hypothetical protein